MTAARVIHVGPWSHLNGLGLDDPLAQWIRHGTRAGYVTARCSSGLRGGLGLCVCVCVGGLLEA